MSINRLADGTQRRTITDRTMRAAVPLVPISVVIATRDRGASVARAIASIVATSYPALEIVVVDQSRDDLTEKAVGPFVESGRVRYIRTATAGVSHGRNLGIAAAANELIAITDDDCEVPGDWLDELAAAFSAHPEAGIVCGNVLPGPHDPGAGFVPGYVRHQATLATGIHQKHEVEGISACMALRRSVWRSLGGFDALLGAGAPLRSGAESDLVVRALLAGHPVFETPRVTVLHHGFRTWEEGRVVVGRYWFGTGAMYARHLRRGHWVVVAVLVRLALRAVRRRSRVAQSLGAHAYHGLRLRSFAQGFVTGALLRERDPARIARAEKSERGGEQQEGR